LEGVRRCVIDAAHKAQGKGCAPGILGVAIGGDRASGFALSKELLFRKLGQRNSSTELAALEEQLINEINQLGIGPMGFGGKTTVLDVFIDHINRVPASFYVSISYMCWAYRRREISIDLSTL
ncbi:MAG: fumarate hydratase, partial [Cellvibrionaceae bacterium]|nr:fumarate hydratase [Cellvibrionaceae bacterium]